MTSRLIVHLILISLVFKGTQVSADFAQSEVAKACQFLKDSLTEDSEQNSDSRTRFEKLWKSFNCSSARHSIQDGSGQLEETFDFPDDDAVTDNEADPGPVVDKAALTTELEDFKKDLVPTNRYSTFRAAALLVLKVIGVLATIIGASIIITLSLAFIIKRSMKSSEPKSKVLKV